ncbi:unnamed protein product [Trichobilharzia szidati]|nr:unnamed protein product [Trichobilharzia szidati]
MSTAINSSASVPPNGVKSVVHSESLPTKVKTSSTNPLCHTPDTTSSQKDPSKVPICLIKLVRSIVRTFYTREHSLIVDMLVRNTIMKEDDLCQRLQFEQKQLRQYLHTLKCDQFIKSKLQLETDTDGKTTKITHYFIDYKLFVNVVKYRLDLMQRRLEAEQRQSTSRASFKCSSCRTTYTDLEVDRLMDFTNPGKLVCVYCRCEVCEEEDNASRTDARALIAKFHHQVRNPIDMMLRECDEIHLSPAILEPEFRRLEPLNDNTDGTQTSSQYAGLDTMDSGESNKRSLSTFGPTENSVRIVLSGNSSSLTQLVKERPIWMSDSTISLNPTTANSEPDSQPTVFSSTIDLHPSHTSEDSVTQTLAPGRVPSAYGSTSSTIKTNSGSQSKLTDAGSSDANMTNATSGTSTASGDIMQLLLVHERRGMPNHNTSKTNSNRYNPQKLPAQSNICTSSDNKSVVDLKSKKFEVIVGGQTMVYSDITPAIVRTMTKEERAEYVRVGKLMYSNIMLE